MHDDIVILPPEYGECLLKNLQHSLEQIMETQLQRLPEGALVVKKLRGDAELRVYRHDSLIPPHSQQLFFIPHEDVEIVGNMLLEISRRQGVQPLDRLSLGCENLQVTLYACQIPSFVACMRAVRDSQSPLPYTARFVEYS